jgi:NTP pyrophosphatase (non-canonical NTP hydrolase)
MDNYQFTSLWAYNNNNKGTTMTNMTFNEYQSMAVKTAIYGVGDRIIYPALGLANECGEVLGKIKKVLRDNQGIYSKDHIEKISDEIGDTLWYMAALARDLDLSLEDIANNNIAKLLDRQARNVIHGSGDQR